MKFRAQVTNMAESEILSMISPEKLRLIKTSDPKPIIKAFVIGHEGESRGNIIGVGNVVKKWYQTAIQKLFDKVNIGLHLFNGHAMESNDSIGRIPIAEVVGKKLKTVKDKLSTIVACWIYPDYKNLPLDVASIEADLELEADRKSQLFVADVHALTGIALGNSSIETPGFPGATLLGQLQAFAERNIVTLFEGGDMTLSELRSLIQEGKFRPSDLFNEDALIADPLITGKIKEHNARGYDGRKSEELEKKIQKLEDQIKQTADQLKAKDDEILSAKKQVAESKIDQLFVDQSKERKFDERQTKFITKNLKRFKVTEPESIEKEFNQFLDSQIDEYKEYAEVMGIQIETPEDEKGKGAEPDEKKPIKQDEKHLNPETNPMIKLDTI